MASIDAVDRSILEVLTRDARVSVNALAEAVGVSRANAYRRLDRLQRDGVIRGYTTRVDPEAVGRPLAVILLISVQQASWKDIRERLGALPDVDYLAATSGEFDFLAILRVTDVATLRDVVLERVHGIPGVVGTRTTFILDEEVRRPF